MTNHYELLYLINATYTEEELEPIKQKVKELIAKFGGEITLEDTLGKKKLTYPIKNNSQGYYLLYEFYLDGENYKKIDSELKLSNEILRHMIVKKKFQSPSLVKKTQEKIQGQDMEPQKSNPSDKKKDDDKDKIKLEDLDEKLDQILEGDII